MELEAGKETSASEMVPSPPRYNYCEVTHMEQKPTFWIIDRIEGDLAVVELAVGKTVTIPLSALPEGAKEGSVLSIVLDKDEEAKRKKKNRSLFDRLKVD